MARHPADTTDTTDATDTAHSANATHAAYTRDAGDTTDAANTSHTADAARAADAAHTARAGVRNEWPEPRHDDVVEQRREARDQVRRHDRVHRRRQGCEEHLARRLAAPARGWLVERQIRGVSVGRRRKSAAPLLCRIVREAVRA
jgi:hypothetical protein